MKNKIAILASILILGSASAFSALAANQPNSTFVNIVTINNNTSQPLMLGNATYEINGQPNSNSGYWGIKPKTIPAHKSHTYAFYLGNDQNPSLTYSAIVTYATQGNVCIIRVKANFKAPQNSWEKYSNEQESTASVSCVGGTVHLSTPAKNTVVNDISYTTTLSSS